MAQVSDLPSVLVAGERVLPTRRADAGHLCYPAAAAWTAPVTQTARCTRWPAEVRPSVPVRSRREQARAQRARLVRYEGGQGCLDGAPSQPVSPALA